MTKTTDFLSKMFPGLIRAYNHAVKHLTNYSGRFPEHDSIRELQAKHDALDSAPVLAGDGFRARDKLAQEIGRRTGNPDAFSDPIGFFRAKGRWPSPSDW